jgi:hypothetical protein
MKRSFIFYTPISIYNLLTLDSRSSLFHNYRIWLWAYPGPWAIHGLGRLFWLAHESPGPSTTGDVYRDSICNISASKNTLKDEGLFALRDPSCLRFVVGETEWSNDGSSVPYAVVD